MGREFTAMSALAATDVPVPQMYAHCQDADVLGAPFYVMERVEGIAIRRASELEERGTERTAAITGRLVDVLARLHAGGPGPGGSVRVRPARGLPRAPGAPLGPAARGLEDPGAPRRPRSCTAG